MTSRLFLSHIDKKNAKLYINKHNLGKLLPVSRRKCVHWLTEQTLT